MLAREYKKLVEYEKLGPEAILSIPTPDHYLPLVYVLGASQERDAMTFPVEGVDGGSVSMLAVRVG
jgi:4,5-DOPA dioxygenase extradiol